MKTYECRFIFVKQVRANSEEEALDKAADELYTGGYNLSDFNECEAEEIG